MEELKFNWKRLLITLGFVVLASAVVGGATWYVMNVRNKIEKQEASLRFIDEMIGSSLCNSKVALTDKQIVTAVQAEGFQDAKIEELDGVSTLVFGYKPAGYFFNAVNWSENKLPLICATDETATWKKYTDHSQRFTLKYPNELSFQEDVASGTDGIFNSNIFTNDNVLFYNADKSIIFGVNVGELFGRGGVCTKREVLYSSVVADKKLVLTKKGDSTKAVATDDYCGVGEALTGYQATVEQFTEAGSKYYIHSEMVSAADSTATQAISFFEKIFNTMTFK